MHTLHGPVIYNLVIHQIIQACILPSNSLFDEVVNMVSYILHLELSWITINTL